MVWGVVCFSLGVGLVGIALSLLLYKYIERLPMGTERMVEIWRAIREGASAYMSRQFRYILTFSLIMAFVAALAVYAGYRVKLLPVYPELKSEVVKESVMVGVSVVIGALASLTAAFLSMDASTKTNVRVTEAARRGEEKALQTAVIGGSVLGFSVPSMSVLGLSALFLLYLTITRGSVNNPLSVRLVLDALAGFAFGASLAALFAQLGGGIYTKAADIGADLVGKVEVGIPEDDPRNPAVIADQVGDNVGDCAGRGADVFESVTAETLGAMIIGWALYFFLVHSKVPATEAVKYVIAPLTVAAVGVLATIPGIATTVFSAGRGYKTPMDPLRNGVIVSSIIIIAGFTVIYKILIPESWIYLTAATLCGVITAILIVLVTNLYTASRAKAVIEIAEASKTGPAITILQGLSVGMRATFLPILIIAVALVISFAIGMRMPLPSPIEARIGGLSITRFIYGVYGTAMGTMGMLSMAGIIMTLDGAGPISDNAGGIAEMSGLEELKERLDPLDALGNVTKALTKGYAMGSAALASLLLFQAFVQDYVARNPGVLVGGSTPTLSLTGFVESLSDFLKYLIMVRPEIVISVLIGAMIPFLFSALALRAVSKAAFHMVEEVRRQFREKPGILEGREKPDYYRAVDISTRYAIKSMLAPGLVVILTPLIIGLLFGGPGVGALVIGATASAIALAIMMMWGGAAWDNAKKFIEEGNLGGKGSPAHAAAVVGDTVGDPLKDTAGPSLHIVVKLLNTISLVFIPLYMLWLLHALFP